MPENPAAALLDTHTPLDERLAAALWHGTSMDEDDAWEAVQVLLPLVTAHAQAEYERGYEYGEHAACTRIADRMGLRFAPAKASQDD